MKRVFSHLMIGLVVCSSVFAQETNNEVLSGSPLGTYMESGAEVSGVRMPYYDEDGNLKAQLYGGHVKVLEGQRAEVTKIRIDVYDKGVVAMTIFAPQCFMHVEESGKEKKLSVESEGDVLITMEQISIIGRGFRFSSDSSRFEILSEAKVLVKESARNAEGLKL